MQDRYKLTGLLLIALSNWFSGPANASSHEIQLLFPIDGLVLTEGYDVSGKPGFQVEIIGLVPYGAEVSVNGEEATVGSPSFVDYNVGFAKVDHGQSAFVAMIDVTDTIFPIEIVALEGDRTIKEIAWCYYWEDNTKTFSVTIDDAIDLFAELVDEDYDTIFEHPVFWFLKRMHKDETRISLPRRERRLPRRVAQAPGEPGDSPSPRGKEWKPFDPCLWKEGDRFYSLAGGSLEGADTAFLFRSGDLLDWEYLHPLYTGGRESDCAVPDFFPIGDKRMLLFASHKRGAQYYLGVWENEGFVLE